MKLSLKDNLQEVKMTLARIAQWLKHRGGVRGGGVASYREEGQGAHVDCDVLGLIWSPEAMHSVKGIKGKKCLS